MKNTIASSARNTPIIAASSTSIHTVNDFGLSMRAEASKPIGMRSAVSNTMNSEMPSTPSVHRIPRVPIHE